MFTLSAIKETVKGNGRRASLVCNFTEAKAPVIEFGNEREGCRHQQVNLADHLETLKKVPDGYAFTMGRESYNDVDLGESDDISRLHCYVVRDGEKFKLYDCSLFGTAIIME